MTNTTLDFFERAYFAELDRKNKLHTALAFPASVVVVGVTLLGWSSAKWNFSGYGAMWMILIVISAMFVLFIFIFNTARFLIGKNYEYIWTLNDMLAHRATLEEFSAQFPDAPAAETTFNDQLLKDIAYCTSHNASLNDQRSEILYNANIAAFVFVLLALVNAGIIAVLEALG